MKAYDLKNMDKDERSLLVFLETRIVDYGGRVNAVHMNKEDFETAKKWNDDKFIEFGRIVFRDHNRDGTNWCKFSDEAWSLAHQERKNRFDRMWLKRNWTTTAESMEINGHPHISGMNSQG